MVCGTVSQALGGQRSADSVQQTAGSKQRTADRELKTENGSLDKLRAGGGDGGNGGGSGTRIE